MRVRLAIVTLVILAALLVTYDVWADDATPGWQLSRDPGGNVIVTRERLPQAPYWIMYAGVTLATVADVESTFRAKARNPHGQEANPIMRPFVNSGRPATYAFSLGLNAITMEIARRSRNRRERSWVAIPSLSMGVHLGAAAINEGQR